MHALARRSAFARSLADAATVRPFLAALVSRERARRSGEPVLGTMQPAVVTTARAA